MRARRSPGPGGQGAAAALPPAEKALARNAARVRAFRPDVLSVAAAFHRTVVVRAPV
jgi:hypothetical protein